MNIHATDMPDIVIIEPQVFRDDRGFFLESFNARRYADCGIRDVFVQDNHSRSSRGVLRGLHYQLRQPQGKLVQVVRGSVYDVAVDLRHNSPTFGKWTSVELSEENNRQIYIPPGFAHGFCVTSEIADVVYKCTDYYAPDDQWTILWDDQTLRIDWPVPHPILSEKDRQGQPFMQAAYFSSD